MRTGTLFALVADGGPRINDFAGIYSGAVIALEASSHETRIYDAAAQTTILKNIVAPVVLSELPFLLQYPPYFYSLIKPLAYFPLPVAWCIWSSISAVLLILSLYCLTANRLPSASSRLFALLATVSSFPCWLCIKLGQTSCWLLLGMVLFFTLLRISKFFQCGLATIFSMIKIQYAPVIVLLGLLYGRVRYLAGLLVTIVILLSYSIFGVGLANTLAYLNIGSTSELAQFRALSDPAAMQNFRGELALFLGGDDRSTHWLFFGFMSLALLMVLLLWRTTCTDLRESRGDRFELCASITVLTALIASPHTYIQDYVVAVIPCVWLWPSARGLTKWLILGFPVLSWIFFLTLPVWRIVHVQPFFLWAVVAIALCLVRIRRLRCASLFWQNVES